MKIPKHFNIDEDIYAEIQKEKNASEIVNSLLKDYYNNGQMKEKELISKIHQVEMEIKNKVEDLKQMQETLNKIHSDSTRLKTIFQNIPKEIMDDIKFFEKMDLEALMNRYNNVYKRQFDIKYDEVKKAFCELRCLDEEGNPI